MTETEELTRTVSVNNSVDWGTVNMDPNPFNSFCTNGKLANYYLLLNQPVPQELDEALINARNKYWLEVQTPEALLDKANTWFIESKKSVEMALEIGDRTGLHRDSYWLERDIDLMKKALECGKCEVGCLIENSIKLLESAKSGLEILKDNVEGVLLHSIVETTPQYKALTHNIVRKWIYGVNMGGSKVAPTEVVYTGLDVGKEEKDRGSTICMPLSIGCPAGCDPCEVGGQFLHGLTSKQMLTMFFRTVKGYALPRIYPSNLKISWLGGGDPAFNMKEFVSAVEGVYKFYPNSTQVVSTLGLNMSNIQRLFELAHRIPTVSLQFSILSMDELVRNKITHIKNLPSPTDILNKIRVEYKLSGKKSFVSLILYGGVNVSGDEISKVLKDGKIDPDCVHITLDCPYRVRKSNYKIANREVYEMTKTSLEKAGYECHIYEVEKLAFEEIGGCGSLNESTKTELAKLIIN